MRSYDSTIVQKNERGRVYCSRVFTKSIAIYGVRCESLVIPTPGRGFRRLGDAETAIFGDSHRRLMASMWLMAARSRLSRCRLSSCPAGVLRKWRLVAASACDGLSHWDTLAGTMSPKNGDDMLRESCLV